MARTYSLPDYARMVADEPRVRAYASALTEVVRPGSVVLDLGAGIGLFALIACKLGARRVFAIELSDAIHAAKELAVENTVRDCVTWIQGDSRAIDLPERVDVIVSDLRGGLPMFGSHLEVIGDARRRFLAPGGVMIPRKDVLWAAPVECPDLYAAHLGPPAGPFGLTLEAVRQRLRNTLVIPDTPLRSERLLAEGAAWAELDYTSVESRPVTGTVQWQAHKSGIAHGILLWFETLLASTGYVTGPERQVLGGRPIYRSPVLPFERPLEVEKLDCIRVDLWVGPTGQPWAWTTLHTSNEGTTKAMLKQSTFLGAPARPVPLVAD